MGPTEAAAEEKWRALPGNLVQSLNCSSRVHTVGHLAVGRLQDVPLESVPLRPMIVACLKNLILRWRLAIIAKFFIPGSTILALLARVEDLARLPCEVPVLAEQFWKYARRADDLPCGGLERPGPRGFGALSAQGR